MYILAQVSSLNNPHYKHFKEAAIARTNSNENVYRVLKSYTSKESKGLSRGLYFGKVVKVKINKADSVEYDEFFKPIFKLNLINKTYVNIINDSEKPIGYLKDLQTPSDIVNYMAINSSSVITELIRKTIRVNDKVEYLDDTLVKQVAKVDSIDKQKGVLVVKDLNSEQYSEINTYQIIYNHGKDL